ncbi:Per1-like protein [Pisolithus thermaeus]|nr:Per1-like protein [Pisolithus croceorrhizus]KAI6147600.1 Per1-like protein [Pisolithus thermaeus]
MLNLRTRFSFWQFLGMQSPASGARQIRGKIPFTQPMRSYYLTWAYASINAWIWSAVFHTRYLPRTEKLDYFSAALAIMYALYLTVIRMLHLHPRATDGRTQKATANLRSTMYMAWSTLCITVCIAHVTYLCILPRFDYTYNMAFNLAIGIAHNLLRFLYSLPRRVSLFRRFPYPPKIYRPAYAYKAGLFVALATAATALELFNFPPVGRILDAHALWHLSIAPIVKLWYTFLVEDALDEGRRTPKH